MQTIIALHAAFSVTPAYPSSRPSSHPSYPVRRLPLVNIFRIGQQLHTYAFCSDVFLDFEQLQVGTLSGGMTRDVGRRALGVWNNLEQAVERLFFGNMSIAGKEDDFRFFHCLTVFSSS